MLSLSGHAVVDRLRKGKSFKRLRTLALEAFRSRMHCPPDRLPRRRTPPWI